MKVKNAMTDYQESAMAQDYDPMEELHCEAYHIMLKVAQHLTEDEIKTMCYMTGLNSSDYIKEQQQ